MSVPKHNSIPMKVFSVLFCTDERLADANKLWYDRKNEAAVSFLYEYPIIARKIAFRQNSWYDENKYNGSDINKRQER